MGSLVKLLHEPQGDIMLIGKTDSKIIVKLFNYKHKNFKYNHKISTHFAKKDDGIHFSVFSDGFVIPLSVFDSLTKVKVKKHEYFK